MRVSNEVTIDREEFHAAVTRMPGGGTRAANRFSPRKTLLYAGAPWLIVETPYVRTEVAAVGAWEQPVAVFSRLLIMVVRKLPKTECITVLYSTGPLFFDRLSIEATLAAGKPAAKDGLLGSADEPLASTPAVALQGRQLLMPGLGGAVTDRERLAHLARAPMRPRRR
jgi:hypothetical protein